MPLSPSCCVHKRVEIVWTEVAFPNVFSLITAIQFFHSHHRIQQRTGNIGTFQTHDAFRGCAEAEKVDAAVPYGFGVDHGEFLMESAFESDCDTKLTEKGGVLSG